MRGYLKNCLSKNKEVMVFFVVCLVLFNGLCMSHAKAKRKPPNFITVPPLIIEIPSNEGKIVDSFGTFTLTGFNG